MQAIFINDPIDITDKGLQAILSSENMKTIAINSAKIRVTGLSPQVNYSKNIQALTLTSVGLSDKGLIQILQHCGSELKTLAIPLTHITGEGFGVLRGKLVNIEKLDLNSCRRFTKQGIIEMLQMCGTQLKVLDMSSTNISATLLIELLQMCGTGLKCLELGHLTISGEGLHVLQSKLITLEHLHLEWCEGITGQCMLEILQMCGTQLKVLELNNTKLTGEGLSVLEGKFVNLETVNLRFCEDITKRGMTDILQVCGTNLKDLDVSNTQITDEYLSGFKGKLIHLENLALADCKGITQQGILELLQLCGSQLKDLGLSRTKVTGEGMSVLHDKFIKLETLDLSCCYNITDQGVRELLQMCGTKLKVLDLSPADISGEGLSELDGKFINLEVLALNGCKDITQEGLVEILQMCGSQLKVLHLCSTKITGEGLSVLQGKFIRLETLDLSCWAGFTEQGLIEIVRMCGTELKDLDLTQTSITCEGLTALEGKLVNLETLNLGFCEDITDHGMRELLQICGAGLRSLILGNPEEIPPSLLVIAEEAQSTHPKLKISEPSY